MCGSSTLRGSTRTRTSCASVALSLSSLWRTGISSYSDAAQSTPSTCTGTVRIQGLALLADRWAYASMTRCWLAAELATKMEPELAAELATGLAALVPCWRCAHLMRPCQAAGPV